MPQGKLRERFNIVIGRQRNNVVGARIAVQEIEGAGAYRSGCTQNRYAARFGLDR
jgi:hypothetical protein